MFAPHRGRGYATRAVHLLMHHLAMRTTRRSVTLLIDAGNDRSLAVAERAGFAQSDASPGHRPGQRCFKRPVPPISYSDESITIRRQRVEDLEVHLEATDDEQIRWLWLPGERERWEAMTPVAQRTDVARGLEANHDAFGTGPKWTFAVDAADTEYVACVDCDLANEHVPRGEANVAYSTHPAHRRRGYATRAVHLVSRFVRDHTGAREVHILVDAENGASLRVVRAVGARERQRWLNDLGRTTIRHVLDARRAP